MTVHTATLPPPMVLLLWLPIAVLVALGVISAALGGILFVVVVGIAMLSA